MSFRFRSAFWLAVLLALMTSVTVLAKGGFAFITITGPGLEEDIHSTKLELTSDFFAFADFYRDRAEAPADPGEGYVITRYYLDSQREVVFDQLHYYPGTGLVFYDGILNGESEYDGGWYSADPQIKPIFERVLADAPVAEAQPVQPLKQVPQMSQASPVGSFDQFRFVIPIVLLVGFRLLSMFAIRLRKPSIH